MIKPIVEKIVSFSPRQGDNEVKTYKYLLETLQKANIPFVDQICPTIIPLTTASLTVDGVEIECRGVSLKSGSWKGKKELISSLLCLEDDYSFSHNINFNPLCSGSVSMPCYFENPAIAVKVDDVPQILNAREVTASVTATPYQFDSHNILVGNCKDPEVVVLTHYDCLESGAIDNASGVAVVLDCLLGKHIPLSNVLVVLAGNEELSYEMPLYWGKGYRAFQKEYSMQLRNCKKIIGIDSVGYSETTASRDPYLLKQAIPLDTMDSLVSKMCCITGDYEKLMHVYHSNDDTVDLLSEKGLVAVQKLLLKLCL